MDSKIDVLKALMEADYIGLGVYVEALANSLYGPLHTIGHRRSIGCQLGTMLRAKPRLVERLVQDQKGGRKPKYLYRLTPAGRKLVAACDV